MSKEMMMRKQMKIAAVFLFLVSAILLSSCTSTVSSAKEETEGLPWSEESTVSYLGPAGTYTEEATQLFFGPKANLFPQRTVDEAIAELRAEHVDFAVIPQENTIGGPVVKYVDALIAQTDVYIVGEVVLPISQTLMGIPGTKLEDIRTVLSHTQGLDQSRTWRSSNLPSAKEEETASTAAAAKHVAEAKDSSIAAVAAPGAARLYGLEVLAENVQISLANRTRFYVLAREPLSGEYSNALLVARCSADRIDDIIVALNRSGLELVALHDRPEGSALGSYYYTIELKSASAITPEQIKVMKGLDDVRYFGTFCVVEK